MYLTLEMRWFYPGRLPGQLVTWLERRSHLPAVQPPRQDHYLRLAGRRALGIKLREGNVEIKKRLDDPGEVEVGPGAVGRMARWRKWSFPLAPRAAPGAGSLEDLLVPGSAWIAVEKERRLRRYRLAGGLQAAAVPLEAPAEVGCEFELATVRAGGQEWWTACFEAFGRESALERALLAVAANVLKDGWPLPLEAEHSSGYPAWLDRFVVPD
jgi:hypothetical protein